MNASRQSWRDVRDRIHSQILSGTYRPGDKLPRDADIAQSFNCARSTVQRAMRELNEEGLIERRRKGGTRVRPDPVTRVTLDIPVTRVEVENRGAVYTHQLFGVSKESPPPNILATFGMSAPEPMLRIRALHRADARPYVFEDRWVSLQTAPEIGKADLSVVSANEWLVQNKPYNRLEMRLFAQAADQFMADTFGVHCGEAMFVIERTTWIDEAPITTVRATTAPGYQLITRS